MGKQSQLFRLISGTIIVFILVVVMLPFVSLAFRPAIPVSSEDEDLNVDAAESFSSPAVNILTETKTQPSPGNIPVFDKLTVSERKAKNLETRLSPTEPYIAAKVVYLTFDDGPDPENTPAVLKILEENKVKATFFVVGSQIEKSPDILHQIYAAGHAIGNHSYNHVYRDLYQSPQSYANQLYQTDDIIHKELGVRPLISRAPGGTTGSFTKAYWDKLRDDGYKDIGWNISSGDASAAKAEQIIANIRYQLEQKFLWSHAIVLMHDGRGHRESVKALPEIIKMFKEKEFEFRVVNTETPPAW